MEAIEALLSVDVVVLESEHEEHFYGVVKGQNRGPLAQAALAGLLNRKVVSPLASLSGASGIGVTSSRALD